MVSFRTKFLISLINLIIFAFIAGNLGAESSSEKEVIIYYTGNTLGYLQACPT